MVDSTEQVKVTSHSPTTLDKIKARRSAKKPGERTTRTKRASTTRISNGSQPNIEEAPTEFTTPEMDSKTAKTIKSNGNGKDDGGAEASEKGSGSKRVGNNRRGRARNAGDDTSSEAGDNAGAIPVEDDDVAAMSEDGEIEPGSEEDVWDSKTDMPDIAPSFEDQALNLNKVTRDEYIAANPEKFADPMFFTITPSIAAQLYARRADQQRKVSHSHVQFLSRQMKEGHWRFNGDTVRLNEKGELLDGQHRCLAGVDSGYSFGAIIVTVSDKSFETIDTGMRIRAVGELFRMEGHQNWTKLAAAVNCIAEHEAGRKVYYASGQKARRSPLELKGLLEKHPNIAHSISMLSKIPPSLGPTAMMGACHYLFWSKHPEKADKFFEDIAEGAGMSKFDPVMKLRERLMRDRVSRTKATKADKYSWIVNAWNARVRGQMIQRLHGQQAGEDPEIL